MRKTLTWALLAGTVACSMLSQGDFQKPQLEMETVQITGLGISGGALNLVLDAYNPNSYDLRTARIEAALDLEDTHFGDVALERDIVLPAKRHAVVEVPMSFTWSGVGAGARGLLRRGAVNYTLDALLWVSTPVGQQRVEFRNEGLAPVKDLIP